MSVGDLIQDNDHGEIGLIVEVGAGERLNYRVLYIKDDGGRTFDWFSKEYVETECEVLG